MSKYNFNPKKTPETRPIAKNYLILENLQRKFSKSFPSRLIKKKVFSEIRHEERLYVESAAFKYRVKLSSF